MEFIRTFIALNLPLGVIDKVAQIQRAFVARANEARAQVAWVPPPNMHVTLRFIGQMPLENLHALRDRLRQGLTDRAGFELEVRGWGAFPNRQHPRVLWIGVQDAERALQQLAGDVESWVCELGFAPETRPFHPHLTLGRVKQAAADAWAGTLADDELVARCAPTEVVLYRSVVQRRGAEYEALARFPLAANKRRAAISER